MKAARESHLRHAVRLSAWMVALAACGFAACGTMGWASTAKRDAGQQSEEPASYGRGIAAFEQGRTGEALMLFRAAAKARPNDARILNAVGNALFVEGDAAGAAAEYRRALAVDPSLGAASKNLGLLEFQVGHFAAARERLARATRLLPRDAVAWRYLGMSFAALERPQDALGPLKRSLALAPDAATRLALARAEAGLGRRGAALADYLALAEDPSLSPGERGPVFRALLALGDGEKQELRSNEAEQAYRQAILIDPKRPEPYLRLGWLYAGFQHYAAAEEVLREGLRFAKPENALEVRLGMVYALDGHEPDAISVLEPAVAAQPDHVTGQAALVIAYTLDDASRGKALAAAAAAVRHCPDSYLVHYLYGGLLLRKERQSLAPAARKKRIAAEARSELEASIRLNPDFSHSHYDLARMEDDAGHLKAAEREAKAALRADPQFASAHYLLGRIDIKEGFRKEGLEEIQLVDRLHRQELERMQTVAQSLLSAQVARPADSTAMSSTAGTKRSIP